MSVKAQDEREAKDLALAHSEAMYALNERDGIRYGFSEGWDACREYVDAALVEAEARKAQLVAALGFYATFDGSIQHLAALTRDGGKTARAALVGVVE